MVVADDVGQLLNVGTDLRRRRVVAVRRGRVLLREERAEVVAALRRVDLRRRVGQRRPDAADERPLLQDDVGQARLLGLERGDEAAEARADDDDVDVRGHGARRRLLRRQLELVPLLRRRHGRAHALRQRRCRLARLGGEAVDGAARHRAVAAQRHRRRLGAGADDGQGPVEGRRVRLDARLRVGADDDGPGPGGVGQRAELRGVDLRRHERNAEADGGERGDAHGHRGVGVGHLAPRDLGALAEGGELEPGDVGGDGRRLGRRGKAAVRRGQDAPGAELLGVAQEAARDELRVLDGGALGVDEARREHLALPERAHLEQSLPLVLVAAVGALEEDDARVDLLDGLPDLDTWHVEVVRARVVAPADVEADVVRVDALERDVERGDVHLDDVADELVVGERGPPRVPAHGQVRAVDLQPQALGGDEAELGGHGQREGVDVLLVRRGVEARLGPAARREEAVLAEERQRARRRHRPEAVLDAAPGCQDGGAEGHKRVDELAVGAGLAVRRPRDAGHVRRGHALRVERDEAVAAGEARGVERHLGHVGRQRHLAAAEVGAHGLAVDRPEAVDAAEELGHVVGPRPLAIVDDVDAAGQLRGQHLCDGSVGGRARQRADVRDGEPHRHARGDLVGAEDAGRLGRRRHGLGRRHGRRLGRRALGLGQHGRDGAHGRLVHHLVDADDSVPVDALESAHHLGQAERVNAEREDVRIDVVRRRRSADARACGPDSGRDVRRRRGGDRRLLGGGRRGRRDLDDDDVLAERLEEHGLVVVERAGKGRRHARDERVRVRPREAKARDADEGAVGDGDVGRRALVGQVERALGGVDGVAVEAAAVDGAADDAAAVRVQRRSDQSNSAGAGLQVAEARLGRGQHGLGGGAGGAVDARQSGHLDGVAERRARAVALDGGDGLGDGAGIGEGGANAALLGVAVDGGDGLLAAVLRRGSADDMRAHGQGARARVAVGDAAQEEHGAAAAARVAVGHGREGVAAARGREEAALAELRVEARLGAAGDDVDAADEGPVDAAAAEVSHGHVESH
mmetsp:Transcript_10280/g.35631  ORF Transcript_10280/g.35631 Transcript_10280/m.35631 type:complete len:1034 (+) Transcript_10280:1403-4504(+)